MPPRPHAPSDPRRVSARGAAIEDETDVLVALRRLAREHDEAQARRVAAWFALALLVVTVVAAALSAGGC